MKQFERVHIKGFRRLLGVDLKLKPLCVLIGANGSGKTSLLDAMSVLSASASGKLKDWISDSGGINANLTCDRSKQMFFELSMEIPDNNPMIYNLALTPSGVGYEIVRESLIQKMSANDSDLFKHIDSDLVNIRYNDAGNHGWAPDTLIHNHLETSLAQVPKMFTEPEDFRNQLASSTHYHVLNVDPRAPVRQPQPLRPADLPGRNGEDLVSCLFSLRETNKDRFETIEDTLRSGFSDFERLDFPPVAAGTLAMTWKDSNFSHPLFMHQLSEGTLRFLWLVTLLQSPGLTAVTMIDEPEVSLHPELLSLLADIMREASERTQLIVATHADRLVRFLKPEEVIVADIIEDGITRMTWADELDLEEWLKEYTLDETWRLGRMGGRS
jgi:predicted ATPase